jgi:hypothetical protein
MAPPPPAKPGAPITKVQEVQLQVEQVSNVMRDNVSQMLSNYEKAEVLEDKAGEHRGGARARRLRAGRRAPAARSQLTRHRPASPRRVRCAANLTQESKKFYKRSNQVKNNMWWKNIKLMGLIACIVLVLLLVIIVPLVVQAQAAKAAFSSATGGGGAQNSGSSSGSGGVNSVNANSTGSNSTGS